MWDRRSILATVALACVWLAALSGCDAMKSEGMTPREYRRVLVEELCAPGGFYSECWWLGSADCHEEIPRWVADCIPSKLVRVRPSEALRQDVLDCVFYFHVAFLGTAMSVADREECVDETRWKHIPPGREGELAKLREWHEERKRQRNPRSVPAIPDTVQEPSPEPSPATVPEPSSGAAPTMVPAQ